MRIALYVPTRGQVWWETAARLPLLWERAEQHDWHLRVEYVQGNTGVVDVRNKLMERFLDGDADVLWMLDDDVVPPVGAVAMAELIGGKRQIVGAPCPVVIGNTPVLPNVFAWDEKLKQASIDVSAATSRDPVRVDAVGFGCVMVGREVCEKLRTFKTRREGGRVVVSEDLEFCLRAKSQGFETWIDPTVACEHMLLMHGNGVALAYAELMERLQAVPVDA